MSDHLYSATLPGIKPDKLNSIMSTISMNNDIARQIKSIRENLGLGRTEFANFLGMTSTGERTVRGWETGEHKPTAKKLTDILKLRA